MSATRRDTQLSIIEGMERPVGPILPSVFTGTNADLMAAVAPLYLTGSVLDVTYGKGNWWKRFTPEPFTYHDLYTVDGVDFRSLPEADGSVDVVCFDPPYVLTGGESTTERVDFQDRFGIGYRNLGRNGGDASSTGFYGLVLAGLAECCRVAGDLVLVKCMEFAQGKDGRGNTRLHDVPTTVTNAAADLGWEVHDRIVHHTGSGPGGHNIFDVKRARRHHSYLIVFAR